MRNVELTNSFHHTTATVRTEVLNHGTHLEITLTQKQMDRARKKLCVDGCTCGGPAGIRGFQGIQGKKLIVNVFPK